MLISSPFEQFEIVELIYYNCYYIFTNSFLILIATFVSYFTFIFFNIITKSKNINIFVKYINILYIFVLTLIKSYLGKKYNYTFFPFLFYLFIFILISNLSGLIPYSFTLTSHFFLNVGLSCTVWLGAYILGVQKQGINFLVLFYPKGASASLILLLGVIEFISWLFRIFSLALRLVANMIAGHILLDCLSFYVYNILYNSFTEISVSFINILNLVFPILAFIILLLFESGVSFLQAYIFIVLSCIYIKEIE